MSKPIRLIHKKNEPGLTAGGVYLIRLHGEDVYLTTSRLLARLTARLMRQTYSAGCADAVAAMAEASSHGWRCHGCGKPVEEARRCYAIPMCYACLPPPPPLPVVGAPAAMAEFVGAYDAWARSDERCGGPLFEGMVIARERLRKVEGKP